MRSLTFLLLGVLFSLNGLSHAVWADPQAQVSVEARVDKTEVTQAETLVFSVSIAGALQASPKVTLANWEGFEVISTGQSQQIQMNAGQAMQALTLHYTLAPIEAGTHTVGPVKVEYEGQVFETQPIEIQVSEQSESEPDPVPDLRGGPLL
jgi:uncharacterized protein (DUF58 family)